MKEYYSILQKNDLFADIDKRNFESLLHCLESYIKHYTKSNIIMMQDDEIKNIGIVLSGVVDIVKEDYMGNKRIISRLSTGESFAETFVCAAIKKSPVTIYCESDADVLFINFTSIISTCAKSCNYHNQLIKNMLKNIAIKTIKLNEKIEYLSKQSIKSKLASYLVNKIQSNESLSFTIDFNRNELADYLKVNRSALSRQLSMLKNEGVLSYRKNTFTIISPSKLFSYSLNH